MICVLVLEWMHATERDLRYLVGHSGIAVARLIAVACGTAQPTVDEMEALAEVMAVPVEALREAAAATRAEDEAAAKEWLSVKEAAREAGVSADTMRTWMRDGRLTYSQLGERITRIRRDDITALLERHMRRTPAIIETAPEAEDTEDSLSPPRDAPERAEDDVLPPPGRLL